MSFRLKIDGQTLHVEPAHLPVSEKGRPGSILHILTSAGWRIQHSCGGIGACTTCHVYVKAGLGGCNATTKVEQLRLPEVLGQEKNSRLACQCVPDGTEDLIVEIP